VCLHLLVPDLGMLVKLWAQSAGVCGVPYGHRLACSFTLMTIYFTQVALGFFSSLGAVGVRPPLELEGLCSELSCPCIFWSHSGHAGEAMGTAGR